MSLAEACRFCFVGFAFVDFLARFLVKLVPCRCFVGALSVALSVCLVGEKFAGAKMSKPAKPLLRDVCGGSFVGALSVLCRFFVLQVLACRCFVGRFFWFVFFLLNIVIENV